MKICNKCKQEQPLDNFNKKRNGLQPYCKPCDRLASRARYKNNKDSHIKNVRQRNLKVIKKNHDYILEYLKTHACVDCGNSDIRVLEFDHIGDDKEYNIANMIGGAYSLSSIDKEIAKCEVRCANCHRIKTAERAQTWRYFIGL